MASELPQTPVDKFSGIPLPLDPDYMPKHPSSFASDMHHAWHNRLDPLLLDAGGLALRASRLQRANYDAHHYDYHRNFSRPPLPTTDEARLRPILMGVAEYIPDQAISFNRRGTPRIVSLTSDKRALMWRSGQVCIDNDRRDDIRVFLQGYIIGQDLSDKDKIIDEFLHTPDHLQRFLLGNTLLETAVHQAADPVDPVYRDAYSQQRIPPRRAKTAARHLINASRLLHNTAKFHEALRLQLAPSG